MDLSKLAFILREHGDEVLNGISKLSLSTKLLHELNESFNLIVEEREALGSTFQVISPSNSRLELLLDLQFLHDFVQRTIGLKLLQDEEHYIKSNEQININKFKNLKLLELRKIPVNQLIGLQSLRAQLQYLMCVRCVTDLKEILINCGGDKSQAYVWNELKEAIFTYNNLENIDHSFEYVPWLQVLDLSHNSIKNAQPIDCLTNLKNLNLGFNRLETVPTFKRNLSKNLQVLILKGNHIEDLTGLVYLDNLVTLDLSCNCLIDHQILSPLPQLAALQWLNLEGNPLSFHPNHRTITARYLHANTATVKFTLDRELLSKSEKLLIGTYHTVMTGKFLPQKLREHQSSVSSNLSDLANSGELTSELTRSQSMPKGRKVRDAIISELDENGDIRDDKGEIVNSALLQSTTSIASNSLPNDYIETQKKIESLRDQYGEEWLKSRGGGGNLMQDILGIDTTQFPKMSSTPYEEDFLIHAADIFNKPNGTPPTTETEHNIDRADVASDLSNNITFVTASESSAFEDKELIAIDSASESASSDEEQFENGEEDLYLAQIQKDGSTSTEIFIVIANNYIKERDTTSGRTICKWLLEVIVSCEIISNQPAVVRLEFDTVRRNMKQREYILEEEEAQKFLRSVREITSKRQLSDLNQTLYNCMKCSAQFTKDKETTITISLNMNKNVSACPNCGSTLIYEIDEESTPTNRNVKQNIVSSQEVQERPESPSECSIASETENKPLAQIHVKAEVHMESTSLQFNCSATSVQESNSSHLSTDEIPITDNVIKRYESDIEVISNPSQSSIEVLDDHIRPGRKRSSEERRTIIVPTLGTIPDVVVPISGGLTESSSSSSITESVYTAYDTHTIQMSRPSSGLDLKQTTIPEKDEQRENQIEDDKNKGNIITSILEGFFSGPTTGLVKTRTISNSTDENDIQFTFDGDFSNVDHRIKYYLYHSIFEDDREHFMWLLRCVLFAVHLPQPVHGCLVLSTNRVYILHIKEHDINDDLSIWFLKKNSYTIDRLRTVNIMPWKQGITLEINNVSNNFIHYLCVLQDIQRTSNFVTFLAENRLPDSCDIFCTYPERIMLNLHNFLLSEPTQLVSKESTLSLLSIFSNGSVINNNTTRKTVTFAVFLVLESDLVILEDIGWLLPDSNKEPKMFASQPISNLLEMDLEDITLDFHFLDEVAGCEEIWSIHWETIDSLNTVISAIRSPWEEIFSVPLQVNHKIHSV